MAAKVFYQPGPVRDKQSRGMPRLPCRSDSSQPQSDGKNDSTAHDHLNDRRHQRRLHELVSNECDRQQLEHHDGIRDP